MSRTLNRVQLIGRLGADPEMRYTQTGTPVTTFAIATNRQWTDRDGNAREETDWHNIVAWDKLAQLCSEYLSKGRLVYIEGRLRYRSWESEGQTRYKTEIVASDMLILDSRNSSTADVEASTSSVSESNGRVESTARAASARPAKQLASVTADDPEDLPF